MTAIGPYEFTEQDVATTLDVVPTLFDLLPGGFPADPEGPAAPYRARAEEALGDVALSPAERLGVVWGAWRSAMAALREAGAYGPTVEGSVAGLFVSDGGVPKSPVEAIEVTYGGVGGDRQADRRHHGRPWQALCLWSVEVIDDFVRSGDPLAPGLAGENLTIAGIPWDRMVPGVQLQLGAVRAEVSAYAIPCKKNAAWFADGRFDRMHHRHGPVSRIYATVLEPGTIHHGDPVQLEPDA